MDGKNRPRKELVVMIRNYTPNSAFEYNGKKYPTTRFGLEKLARDCAQKVYVDYCIYDLRRLADNEHCLDQLKTYFAYRAIENFLNRTRDFVGSIIREKMSEKAKIAKLKLPTAVYSFINEHYWAFDFSIAQDLGYVRPLDDFRNENYLAIDEAVRVGYHRYITKELANKARRRCEICGNVYFDQDELLRSGLSRYEIGNFDNVGIDGYCPDCADYEGDYHRCTECSLWYRDAELNYVENIDNYVCDDCVSDGDYHRCERCGDLVYTGDGGDYVWTADDSFYCCEDCAENDGYHWSERLDCWTSDDEDENVNEIDEYVGHYHENAYTYNEIAEKLPKAKNQKHTLAIGCETEMDNHDMHAESVDFYENVRKTLDYKVVYETDGSLNEGLEMISTPMVEKDFMNEEFWEKGYALLRDVGFRSHDTSTCGKHFHFSKWYLGRNYKEQLNSAKKICYFFEKNWEDLVKISRRKDSELHWCDKFGFFPNAKTNVRQLSYNHDHRYHAVNLEHLVSHYHDYDEGGTIEIRICKGTLNAETTVASADFFLHIVRNAKRISWKNIDNLKLWFKGIKNKNTIDYIKSRNAFVGSF